MPTWRRHLEGRVERLKIASAREPKVLSRGRNLSLDHGRKRTIHRQKNLRNSSMRWRTTVKRRGGERNIRERIEFEASINKKAS